MSIPTSKPASLKTLLLLHKAMLSVQIAFVMIAFLLVYNRSSVVNFASLNEVLQVISIALSATGFYLGTFLFKKKILRAREASDGAAHKFVLYRQACILQWALNEGTSLFVIVCFLLTGNYAFAALAIVLMLLFAMMAPSRLKIALQLQLSEEELAKL